MYVKTLWPLGYLCYMYPQGLVSGPDRCLRVRVQRYWLVLLEHEDRARWVEKRVHGPYSRIRTARKVMGWSWHFFHQIGPNWPLPYSIMPVPRLRDARPAGWAPFCSTCPSTMPRAQNRAGKGSITVYCEDDLLFLSSYYLSMTWTVQNTVLQGPLWTKIFLSFPEKMPYS